jgi:endonuclease-3
MTKKTACNICYKYVKEFYPTIPPADHKDPYTLLIAVLLSAQCTDVRVNQITSCCLPRLIIHDMIK